MSPLDALTGQHEEEDGGNHAGSARLLPQQHGWTDGEWAAAAAAAESEDVVSLWSAVQPPMSTCSDGVIWTVSSARSAQAASSP